MKKSSTLIGYENINKLDTYFNIKTRLSEAGFFLGRRTYLQKASFTNHADILIAANNKVSNITIQTTIKLISIPTNAYDTGSCPIKYANNADSNPKSKAT
jgi:hypothetical protein